MTALQNEILEFWFCGEATGQPVSTQRMRFWFSGGGVADRLIRDKFSSAVALAAAGGLAGWTSTPRGTLALLLLLDQFPRNIFRDSPRAYVLDSQALQLSLGGLDAGQDRALAIVERLFFYLPLEHAEDLAMQNRSVALFKALRSVAAPELQAMCDGFLDYAERHREVIARFGRFPHRNRVLGRASTQAEEAFLALPGSSF